MARKPPPTSHTPDNAQPGDNGQPRRTHLPSGKFAPGNKLGQGNPFHRKAHALRSSLFAAVTEADVTQVVRKLIAMAKRGEIHAIRELLDRVLGKPVASIELTTGEAKERLEDMTDEELLAIAGPPARSK
jgi:hypothetical protein